MHFGIDGRSALIVGGSKGIGFEVPDQLASEGAKVVGVARAKADVDAAVEAIRNKGGAVIGVAANVSSSDQVGDAVRQVTAKHGPPLIVVGRV
jgi:3-oxoacyl-[acyl-carrier protein] reductase